MKTRKNKPKKQSNARLSVQKHGFFLAILFAGVMLSIRAQEFPPKPQKDTPPGLRSVGTFPTPYQQDTIKLPEYKFKSYSPLVQQRKYHYGIKVK